MAFLGLIISAKQFLMTNNRCAVSQLFVGFAVKHFARTDGINKLCNATYTVSEKDCTHFLFFFLGAQCVESGVSCTDCY